MNLIVDSHILYKLLIKFIFKNILFKVNVSAFDCIINI